ncbi:MAG: microtubule-binding calmodulin-regulated spectrin-associated-domain-containing protein, partial [Olpidium bornovanus]
MAFSLRDHVAAAPLLRSRFTERLVDKCRPASAGIPKTPTRTSHRSNRQLVRNALVHICLAGTVNTNTKEEVLEDLDGFAGDNFVILFRGTKDHAFRALYSYDAKTSEVLKVYGTGPMSLTGAQVAEFYKYDSGSRSFKTVPTKSFGIS